MTEHIVKGKTSKKNNSKLWDVLLNTGRIEEKELIVFIKLNELTIDKNIANVSLTIQNAILLLEDKQQVEVIAKLNKKGNVWEIMQYDLKRINISY